MSDKLKIALLEGLAIGIGFVLAQAALKKLIPDDADDAV
jgi:hypothetical protein